MGMSKIIRKGSLSYNLLGVLEKSVDGYVRFDDFLNNSWIYARGYQRNLAKTKLSKALNRLKNNGLIYTDKIDGKLIYKLIKPTNEIFIDDSQKEWDGIWRVVIFDIPEQKRVLRNLFRRNLKKWGFQPLQKSVWVSKQAVFEKLNNYIKELGLTEYIKVFESKRHSF